MTHTHPHNLPWKQTYDVLHNSRFPAFHCDVGVVYTYRKLNYKRCGCRTVNSYALVVNLPVTDIRVSGGGGGLTGACVLFASCSQSVGA